MEIFFTSKFVFQKRVIFVLNNKFRKPYYVDDVFVVIAKLIQLDHINCSSKIFGTGNKIYQPLMLHSCNHSNCNENARSSFRNAESEAYNGNKYFDCQKNLTGNNGTATSDYWFCYVNITRKLDGNDLIEAGPVSQHPLKLFL